MDETPPRPETDAEWAAHWAFYKLTVAQRDAAWREIEQIKARLMQNAEGAGHG